MNRSRINQDVCFRRFIKADESKGFGQEKRSISLVERARTFHSVLEDMKPVKGTATKSGQCSVRRFFEQRNSTDRKVRKVLGPLNTWTLSRELSVLSTYPAHDEGQPKEDLREENLLGCTFIVSNKTNAKKKYREKYNE